jgi:menaquinone-9 beta-reductase
VQVRSTDADVIVVGAGPAGLACAIASANLGLTVLVIDGMKPPIDKACGEGLMPDSLSALSALGIDLHPLSLKGAVLRGIRFLSDTGGDPTVNQAPFPATPGLGIRRTVLHQLLVDRALALGVNFQWETVLLGITQHPHGNTVRTNHRQTGDSLLHSRYLIGADGHQSRVAASAHFAPATTYSRRIGLRQHYAIAPWTDFVEVYWSRSAQAYVTPTGPSEVCVAYIADRKLPSPHLTLSQFPALERHLSSATPSDDPRGAVTLHRRRSRVISGNVALIGDASGSVDAITGEGLHLAFRQALALADALHAGDLTRYQLAHRSIQRLPHLMSRSMLLMHRSAFIRNKALSSFHRKPALFSRLLDLHVGHSPVQFFGSRGLLVSGLQILT